MSLILVEMGEELPTYSGRIEIIPSYNDTIERYREQLNQHYERNNKIGYELIFLWILLIFILFVLVVPIIVVRIRF